MTITKTDLKFITPFLLYVGFGIWCSHLYKFREDHKALLFTFKWFIAPSIISGIIYSYYSVYKRGPSQAKWKKVLALVALSLIFTLLFLRSSEGYLLFWNAYFGNQVRFNVKGTVSRLNYPKRKKPLNSYAIYIDTGSTGERIYLNVPTNDYTVGQSFEKIMTKGSLGILYSR